MKILGISASRRQWGNTDILIHHVLQGAGCEGAETQFLRLTDFDIQQCRGCLSCLVKEQDCVIEDRFIDVLSAMREADGIVLGSPVHTLFAAGSLQILMPRFFHQAYTGEFEGKPGIALAVGGRPGWEGWALQQVSSFFLSLGMPLIDHFMGYGQGPGEVFYDTRACSRALATGRAMARGEEAYRGEPGTCPVCHFDLIFTRKDGRSICMLCDLPGQSEPPSGSQSRWAAKENRKHFEDLILPSRKRFLARKEEIQRKLEAFKKKMP